MEMDELKAAIAKKRSEYISKLIGVLREDPDASEYIKTYARTEEYLNELIEKKGSIFFGIIVALEHHLEK